MPFLFKSLLNLYAVFMDLSYVNILSIWSFHICSFYYFHLNHISMQIIVLNEWCLCCYLYYVNLACYYHLSFHKGSCSKESTCNAGDTGNMGSIPGWGSFPGGGYGNPLQYSCLENLMDREAWWATVHKVTKNWIIYL